VHDHDEVDSGQAEGRLDGGADAVGLVLGRDDDRGVARRHDFLAMRNSCGTSSCTVKTESSPVTCRIFCTAGRGAATSRVPPRSFSRLRADSSTFIPVESQKSTADMSMTTRPGPTWSRRVNSDCSWGAV